MAELRVAVIGVGKMGTFHVDPLTRRVHGARVETDPLAAVFASDVDAVVLASPGFAHEKQVLACLEAGKPVLCEKPLTMDEPSALAVVRAEAETGRRLVQLGFMRRFDHEYARLRSMVTSGELGNPLLMHCVHRNPQVPEHFTSAFAMADSVVHEVDCTRFLLGEEITAVTALKPAATSSSPAGNADPMLVLFETSSGRLVDVESFVRTGVAYEVRTELVAEHGMVTIGLDQGPVVRRDGRWGGELAPDFVVRFGQAYDSQMQSFVDAAAQGTVTGPGAWDGYAAVAVCAAGVEAVTSGSRVEVRLGEKP